MALVSCCLATEMCECNACLQVSYRMAAIYAISKLVSTTMLKSNMHELLVNSLRL